MLEHLTNLVYGLHDPVNARITTDSLVLWIHQDNLKVLVSGVLVDPVRVENAEIGASSSDTFLSGGF